MPWREDSAPEIRKGGFSVTEHSLLGFGEIVEITQVLKPCIKFLIFQRIFSTDTTTSTMMTLMWRHYIKCGNTDDEVLCDQKDLYTLPLKSLWSVQFLV